MTTRLLALVLACSACGATKEPGKLSDERLRPLLDMFVSDAAAHGVALDASRLKDLVVFKYDSESEMAAKKQTSGVVGGDTLGLCVHGSGSDKTHLTPSYSWYEVHILDPGASAAATYTADTADFNLRRVVYHELGHCLLGKGHSGTPSGSLDIMAADHVEAKDPGGKLWPALVDQLYSPGYLNNLPSQG